MCARTWFLSSQHFVHENSTSSELWNGLLEVSIRAKPTSTSVRATEFAGQLFGLPVTSEFVKELWSTHSWNDWGHRLEFFSWKRIPRCLHGVKFSKLGWGNWLVSPPFSTSMLSDCGGWGARTGGRGREMWSLPPTGRRATGLSDSVLCIHLQIMKLIL